MCYQKNIIESPEVGNEPHRFPSDEKQGPNSQPMLYKIGRGLQLLGLLITPVGAAGNIARPDQVNVKATLLIAAGGIGVFFLGWLLQQGSRPS